MTYVSFFPYSFFLKKKIQTTCTCARARRGGGRECSKMLLLPSVTMSFLGSDRVIALFTFGAGELRLSPSFDLLRDFLSFNAGEARVS